MEIGIVVWREYDYVMWVLDENEINIIEWVLNEVEWKSVNVRDLGKYDKKLWDFVCSRLKDCVLFVVYKCWWDYENVSFGWMF